MASARPGCLVDDGYACHDDIEDSRGRGTLVLSAKTKSDRDDKVLVVQRAARSCRKEARRDDNSG